MSRRSKSNDQFLRMQPLTSHFCRAREGVVHAQDDASAARASGGRSSRAGRAASGGGSLLTMVACRSARHFAAASYQLLPASSRKSL